MSNSLLCNYHEDCLDYDFNEDKCRLGRNPKTCKKAIRIQDPTKFDIAICSNRGKAMWQVRKTRQNFPESSVILILSEVNYGKFRQLALNCITTPTFLMLDDDIDYEIKVIWKMHQTLLDNPKAIAVHPKLLFTEDEELHKALKQMASKVVGGCCMFRTSHIRKLGYNTLMNVGEDTDLYNRALDKGYEWLTLQDDYVIHQDTRLSFMTRKLRYVRTLDNPLKTFERILIRLVPIDLRILFKSRSIKGSLTVTAHHFLEVLMFLRCLKLMNGRT